MGCLTVNQKKALPLDGSKDLIWAEPYLKVKSLVSIAFLGNKKQNKQTKKKPALLWLYATLLQGV